MPAEHVGQSLLSASPVVESECSAASALAEEKMVYPERTILGGEVYLSPIERTR